MCDRRGARARDDEEEYYKSSIPARLQMSALLPTHASPGKQKIRRRRRRRIRNEEKVVEEEEEEENSFPSNR